MMKQVQELQSKMAELQAELETMEVEGTSEGAWSKYLDRKGFDGANFD